MNIHDNRRRFQNSQIGPARPAMTATRSATDFEIMQQEHIEQLKAELAEARARLAVIERAHDSTIEEQAALCSEGQSITELVAAKDALIEQLKLALKTLRKYPHTYKMTGQSSIVVDKDIEQCNAALLAAERGGE